MIWVTRHAANQIRLWRRIFGPSRSGGLLLRPFEDRVFEREWHLGTSWDAAMQTSLHFNKAMGPFHDLQTNSPCLYVLNHGLWHKWNCLHRCPTRYGAIGPQSLQKYAKVLATKVSISSIIKICHVVLLVVQCVIKIYHSCHLFPASRWRALQLHKKRIAARRRAWKQEARRNFTWRGNGGSCSFYRIHISDGLPVLFLFNFIDIECCTFVTTGMFKIQGRLKTIRKEVIREWGCNPST